MIWHRYILLIKTLSTSWDWFDIAAKSPTLDKAATALSAGQQIYNFFKPPVSQNNIKSRGFEDDEDLFVHEIDAFDNLKAQEPSTGNYGSAASVFFYIYGSKMQISGHIANPKLWKVSAQLRPPSALDSKFPAFSIPMVRIISNPVNLKTRKTYSYIDRTDCCIGTDMPILAYYLRIINIFCTLYWIKTDI